jgi:hypothetical protein
VAAYRGERRHGLSRLAEELKLAKSTVHAALERPRAIGAIDSSRAGVRILDPERLLLIWAGHRNLGRDVTYETRTASEPFEVEALLAAEFVLGAFAAYRQEMGRNTVADYDTVIAYGAANRAIQLVPRRRRGATRVLILEPDPLLSKYGSHTPLPQTYVDLFNLPGWQAARFFIELTRRLFAEPAA